MVMVVVIVMVMVMVIVMVIVSFKKVKKHYACLAIPPVCAEWVNKMETRWREENITR